MQSYIYYVYIPARWCVVSLNCGGIPAPQFQGTLHTPWPKNQRGVNRIHCPVGDRNQITAIKGAGRCGQPWRMRCARLTPSGYCWRCLAWAARSLHHLPGGIRALWLNLPQLQRPFLRRCGSAWKRLQSCGNTVGFLGRSVLLYQ